MPIYRYQCVRCGWEEDYLEPMSAPTEKRDLHPDRASREPRGCEGPLKRIPSAASFKFNCSMPTYQRKKT